MVNRISLITAFVLLNMGVGRLFQESTEIVCFSELSIIAITGFFFWNASAKQIKKWSFNFSKSSKGSNLLIHSGLGLTASFLNILIGQALVIFLMSVFYNCTAPSANFLSAVMTNNVGLNLLCYFALLFYAMVSKMQPIQNKSSGDAEENESEQIVLTKKGFQYFMLPQEIIFVETSNNCIIIHTEKGKFVKYQSLKSFSESVCPDYFKRVHRSYLVNPSFIDHVRKNHSGDGTVYLKTGEDIRFSRNYFKSL